MIYTPKVLEIYSKIDNPKQMISWVNENIQWFNIFESPLVKNLDISRYSGNLGEELKKGHYLEIKTPEEVILSKTATCYDMGTFFCYWLLRHEYQDVSSLVVTFQENSLYNNHAFSFFREKNTWSSLFSFVVNQKTEYARGFLTMNEFMFYLEEKVGPVNRVYQYSTIDRDKLAGKPFDRAFVWINNNLVGI